MGAQSLEEQPHHRWKAASRWICTDAPPSGCASQAYVALFAAFPDHAEPITGETRMALWLSAHVDSDNAPTTSTPAAMTLP
jgi:hypothetical protein